MEQRKDVLNNYYENYDEDGRLKRDKTHYVEYVLTKTYIDKYLKENDKVLEVGAGTGRYSLQLAKEGYDVTSIEYVEHNLEILKSKITPNMKIRAEQGDALDLSRFEDNTFDVTLVLGPLYHLFNDEDINKAISEAIRVTKKGGIIFIAYIPSDSIFVNWGVEHLIDGYGKEFGDDFKLVRAPEEIFAPFYISEFKEIMSKHPVTFLHNVGVDGITKLIREKINNLSEEEYKMWLKYLLATCEREDLQGYSGHVLYICRKD
jgi:ubiquinone/menaquinone biosynthesis C-methylase UbiE